MGKRRDVELEVRCRICADPAEHVLCKSCLKSAKLGAFVGYIAALVGFPAWEFVVNLFL